MAMPMPKPEWEAEHALLKGVQEHRLHAEAALSCTEKCITTYYMNSLLPFEQSCLERCLAKHAQADIIINFNMQLERQGASRKRPVG